MFPSEVGTVTRTKVRSQRRVCGQIRKQSRTLTAERQPWPEAQRKASTSSESDLFYLIHRISAHLHVSVEEMGGGA